MLLAALAPAADRDLIAWLVALSGMVARRSVGDADAEIILASYVERLREYPADIVHDVLHDWPNRSQWWPTWFELRELLEPPANVRRALLSDLDAIERAMNTPRIEESPATKAKREKAAAQAAARERAEVSAGLRGLVVKLSDARKVAARPKTAVSRRFAGEDDEEGAA